MAGSGFPRKFGRYELLGHLSNGGMAQVYVARVLGQSTSSAKVIALKTVLPNLADDQSFLRLFEGEIGLAMALSDPNIVRIYDYGVVDGEYYLAMEFVFGKNLQAIGAELQKAGSLAPLGFTCFTVAQICRALAYAHSYCDPISKKHAGIIHRDISPHNILVAYNGQVKLFDFGVAKIGSREGQTEAGVVKGKPAYLAPEQALGEELDDRVDIFALGIVLWEQLTGRRLFFDAQPLMAIKKVVEMEIPVPSSINPGIPASVDKIVMKALQRDKMQRYQLSKEFGADLEKALQAEGITWAERQSRELMAAVFQRQMTEELASLQQKFQGRAADVSVPTVGPAAPPPLPSSLAANENTQSFTLPSGVAPQPGYAPKAEVRYSLKNIAVGLCLVLLGAFLDSLWRPDPVSAPVLTPIARREEPALPRALHDSGAFPSKATAAAPAAAPVVLKPAPAPVVRGPAGPSLKELEEQQLSQFRAKPGALANAAAVPAPVQPAVAEPVAQPAQTPSAPSAAVAPPSRQPASDDNTPSETICDQSMAFQANCSGMGFIGCLGGDSISHFGGLNSGGGAIEYYCEGGKTRVCLSGEYCPWRGGGNPVQYPQGLSLVTVPISSLICSPYGLNTMPNGPPAVMATCKGGGNCGFTKLYCDGQGNVSVN